MGLRDRRWSANAKKEKRRRERTSATTTGPWWNQSDDGQSVNRVARSHFHWSVISMRAHCTNAQIKRNANAVRPSLIICPRILEHRSRFLVVLQLIPKQTRTEISWTTIWEFTLVLQNPETVNYLKFIRYPYLLLQLNYECGIHLIMSEEFSSWKDSWEAPPTTTSQLRNVK